MMSFRVGSKIGSRRDDDGEQIVTVRTMERDRAVVSRVRGVARWGTTAEGRTDSADGRVVCAEDRCRLEGPSHRSVRSVVQDLYAANRRVDSPRSVATNTRVVPGQAARRGPAGLVAGAGRLQFGEGSAGRAKTGPNPTDRGRQGSKHCVLTDAAGVPLVVQTVGANRLHVQEA